MNNNLKKITNKTIQDLLQNEIILPSSYFESFDKNAKKLSVELESPQFESEVSNVIVNDFKNINSYMKKISENIEVLTEATDEAQTAIKEKDTTKLQAVNLTLNELKDEINSLKGLIYIDPLTKTFNRRWVYNYAINQDGTFKNEGLLTFIDLIDCNYLADKYGNALVDNVVLFISKFLTEKFKKENIEVAISRYSNNQFILFIKNESPENMQSVLKNIKMELLNTTLKSKSGLMFKTTFHFGLTQYNSKDVFQDSIEKVAALATQDIEPPKT